MTAGSLASRLVFYFTLIIILAGASTGAYAEKGSVLEVVPEETLICVKLTNLRDFDSKVASLVKSLNIPDVSELNVAQLMGKMTGINVSNLMNLEDAGFDMRNDACVFWRTLSLDKLGFAIHVSSIKDAELAVRSQIGGVDKQYRGVTYGVSEGKFAWVFLDDVFVYSPDKAVIMDVIKTHLKDKPSILQNENYLAGTKSLRTGHITGYAGLDKIVSTFLPVLESQAKKTRKNLARQMAQQEKQAGKPSMNFDVAKIVGEEMDMGLWILKQIRSYAVSIGVGRDGIWVNDLLKLKPDSPICDFLKIKPRRLELVKYLPSNIFMAGGVTLDAAATEKFNSIMFDLMMSVMPKEMVEGKAPEIRKKYDAIVHDILSCLGDEVAFAIPAISDGMMQRIIYVLEISDEDKARNTIGNLDYMMEISKPFTDMFGMNFQMIKGPTQSYSGIQIRSFQMDLSTMANLAPNAASMYPEKAFLWYAFVDDKMIYVMSQSSDTIKEAIDTVRGKKASIMDLPGFDDVNIRLPQKNNMVVYISPMGYMNFMMGMMMGAVGGRMSPGSTTKAMKSDIGFGVTTKLDGDGVRNFAYFLVREIQELINAGINMGRIVQMQTKPRIHTGKRLGSKE